MVCRVLLVFLAQFGGAGAQATVLWSDTAATLVQDSGLGRDTLGGALKRDETSGDILYFKFHIDPLSDSTTEEYFAALQLFEGDEPRLGIGNAPEAWAYTAFFEVPDSLASTSSTKYVDLRSAGMGAEGSGGASNYELPRRGIERTLVFKVQYVPNGEDLVTVWLNPDLSPGATELLQPEALTTRFSANASFDEIRLRHGGGGEGWVFSELAIASTFVDFVDPSSAMLRTAGPGAMFSRERISLQTWNREPGMPRGAVSALAQTAEGYLWLAGEDGLARFDGVHFVGWDIQTATGGGLITTMLGDSHGALWIGTRDQGVTRHTHGQFTHYTATGPLPANSITAMAEDHEGVVWIGTSSGLVAWQDNGFRQVEDALARLQGSAIKALCVDVSGALWIAVEGQGVFCHQRGSLTQLNDPQAEEWLRNPQCLLVGREGKLWVGVGDDMVLCRDGNDWRRYRIPRRSGTPHVKALAEEPDGTVWAASATEGLFRFDQGRLVAINANAGLTDSQTSALLLDQEGNLWIGGGAGLHLLRRERHFKLGPAEGLGQGPVAGVAEVLPGVVWAIQPGHGLFRWDTKSFRRLNAAGLDPADTNLTALLVTRDGACWIAGSEGLHLYRDPQAVADERLLFPFPHGTISALAEAEDRSIWVGTIEGQLWQLRRGEWIKSMQWDSSPAITALAAGQGDMVWVATEGGGLYAVENSVPSRVLMRTGFLSDSLRALHLDAEGVLWIGSAGGGLAGLAQETTVNFTTREGLPDNHIWGILEDSAGRLWLHDNAGLACIAKPALTAARIEVWSAYPMLGRSTSVVPAQEDDRVFAGGCVTRSGHVWFNATDGILVAEAQAMASQAASPGIILEAVLVDGVPAKGFEPVYVGRSEPVHRSPEPRALRLGPGRHRVELRFTSPDLAGRKRWQFRYRMQGLDEDWVEAGGTRAAVYSYLPPGNYQFTVAVFGPHHGSTQTSLKLAVSPHFWQRGWVMAGGVLGMVAAIASSARFVEKRRMDRRLRRLEQEHALERERTRIAQDLHDEMGAKLCRISFLSEHAGRLEPGSGEIKEQISAIAEDSRQLLHALDEIVWVVNPQNDTLEHLASYTGQYAQNYFHGTGIDCEVQLPGHLPPAAVSSQVRHHLFLAVHEALTNVLKHSGATQVQVSMAWQDPWFSVEVKDNGSGFVVPDAPGRDEAKDGLLNMRERMHGIGGRCQMESLPGRGTTIQFQIQFNRPGKSRANT